MHSTFYRGMDWSSRLSACAPNTLLLPVRIIDTLPRCPSSRRRQPLNELTVWLAVDPIDDRTKYGNSLLALYLHTYTRSVIAEARRS